MAETLISEEMRALVGKEFGTGQTSVPISLSDIRRWAMAVYYPEAPPRLFWDEEYAAGTRFGGVVAPQEFNPFAWFTSDGPRVAPSFTGPIRNTGPEGAFGVEPPETSFILNGGSSVVYGVRMRPGDVITSHQTRLVSYEEREGRMGPMLFTTTEVVWTNQKDETVKTTRGIGIRY